MYALLLLCTEIVLRYSSICYDWCYFPLFSLLFLWLSFSNFSFYYNYFGTFTVFFFSALEHYYLLVILCDTDHLLIYELHIFTGFTIPLVMRVHLRMLLSIMHHVLSALFLLELQLSWFLLRQFALPPGQESTMATWQPIMMVTVDHHTPVLIVAQKECQGLVFISNCFTTPLLLAMASHALLMKATEYSPVWSVQSNNEQ